MKSTVKKSDTQNKKSLKRKIYSGARTLHIYISASLFALLVLFCITGFLLNHEEWFSNDYQEATVDFAIPKTLQAKINTAWVSKNAPFDAIDQQVRLTHSNLPEPNSSNIDYDLKEITLDYKIPTGYASLVITEDAATFSYRKGGTVTLLKDLHRGRNTGFIWARVIDIMAIFILCFAITGMVLLFQNKKKRKIGFFAALLGVITPVVVVLLVVPRL